jgi:hypothetical protein
MKLSVWGTVRLVYSMITKVKEDQLENEFNEFNVVKAEGSITLTLSDGSKQIITIEDLKSLQVDMETIGDVEDEK